MTRQATTVGGYADATAILGALTSGEISSSGLVEELIGVSEAASDLSAFSQMDVDAVRRSAAEADRKRQAGDDSLLLGLPVCIKDNIDVAGMATTAGTPALARNFASANAPVVEKLLEQGAILFGKTCMHELAYGTSGENAWQGAVRNPFQTNRIAGGSSSGTAAAIAAGVVPVGLGSDTGGSVRIPAAFCGLAGLRPTTGRYPSERVFPISKSRDTVGPLARSFSDLKLIDSVISGAVGVAEASLKNVRLGIPDAYFYDGLDPIVAGVSTSALEQLREAGVTLVPVPGEEFGRLYRRAGFTVTLFETRATIEDYLSRFGVETTYEEIVAGVASPDVQAIMADIANRNPVEFAAAYRQAMGTDRPALQALYAETFVGNRLDGIAFPTSKLPAPLIGEDVVLEEGVTPVFEVMIENTGPGSLAGLPGITVPCGKTPEGVPLGLAIDGPFWSDSYLLRLGSALETVIPNPWRAT